VKDREEQYDSFYRSTRRDVLLQTFALTGDLPAAQGAVRDAYVSAWQHWRKVSRLDDPLDWVRPRAWQLAQRRHTARIWHRNKGMREDHRTVLDALARLPVAQRRVVLLVTLGGVGLTPAARELGVTREVAERSLAVGTQALAAALDAPADDVRPRLLGLADSLDNATMPRGPIVRRAGRKRRQGQALVGALVTLAVALASGAFAYQPGRSAADDLHVLRPPTSATVDTAQTLPTASNMLDRDQIRRLGLSHPWQVVSTSNNTAGDGINTPCQQARFADPDGYSAIVRLFRGTGPVKRDAVQTVEVSRSERAARAGFRKTVGWYAGCRLGRLQVLTSYRVDNIGDEAEALLLRIWRKPVTTMSVAVARTGTVTTSTVGTTVGGAPPPPGQITQSLADSVAMLCSRSGSTDCAKRPTYRVVPPPPSGGERGILAVPDLPPVGRINAPWVGTEPADGRVNPSATTCDHADFAKGGAVRTRTRTYLIPQAKVPARFGLSETYGVFRSSRAASRFLAGVRHTVGRCEKRDLATKVTSPVRQHVASPPLDLSSWELSTEVSAKQKVHFRLGFVRVGNTVAQLTFAPSPRDDMTSPAFHALLERAGDRLRELD
jgi:DNA-directed RNA polymerase specialized sigma24 family protein